MHSVAKAAKREMGRAFEPGPLAVVALLLTTTALAGCGGASKYPSFLPKATIDPKVDTVLVGTTARPALTVEGLAVAVHAPAFRVTVTVAGPVVPGEGLPYQQPATTCTWTVTMKDATADVRIALSDFHAIDHLGGVQIPRLVPGESPPPPVLRPGHVLRFQLRAYELVGDGVMQWAPDHRHVVASWDYTVEND